MEDVEKNKRLVELIVKTDDIKIQARPEVKPGTIHMIISIEDGEALAFPDTIDMRTKKDGQ